MIYYKVVRNFNNKLMSARTTKDSIIIYKIKKWVKPKIPNSKIFIFKDLYDAKDFYYKQFNEEIYECEAKNVEKADLITYYSDDIQRFWSTSFNKRLYGRKPFIGTYFADSIKLLRKVENE